MKQNVIYTYNRLFIPQKEWNYHVCYSVDEPWKHAKGNKADTKGQLLYASETVQSIGADSGMVVTVV